MDKITIYTKLANARNDLQEISDESDFKYWAEAQEIYDRLRRLARKVQDL